MLRLIVVLIDHVLVPVPIILTAIGRSTPRSLMSSVLFVPIMFLILLDSLGNNTAVLVDISLVDSCIQMAVPLPANLLQTLHVVVLTQQLVMVLQSPFEILNCIF